MPEECERERGGAGWVGLAWAGVIVPFAAITTKSIIHLYKLKAKNSPINDNHVDKCCHGHCCSPVRAVAVLVDIFISKLILIDYILCATVQTAEAAAAARSGHTLLFVSVRVSRALDILNYHFIYNMLA